MRRSLLLSIFLVGLCCFLRLGSFTPVLAFEASDRWIATATDGNTWPEGNPITLTWSLPDEGAPIDVGTNRLISMLDTEFGTAPGDDYRDRPWYRLFEESFARLSELAGVDYVYEPEDDNISFSSNFSRRGILGTRGDVRIGGRSFGAESTTLAANYFPDYGEMIINSDKGSSFDNSANDFRFFRNTIMHEALHGLGIEHVKADPAAFLMETTITTSFEGPQLDDLLAMQRLYGDVFEKQGGNDAFTTATPLGIISSSQAAIRGLHGNSTVITSDQSDFLSIDDNTDFDFFSFMLMEPLEVAIDLAPKGGVYSVGPQNGMAITLDTLALSDLSLVLYDDSGQSALGSVNSTGIGEAESLLMSLDPGTYYTRVAGAHDNTQLYQIAITPFESPQNLTWTGQQSNAWDLYSTANFVDDTGTSIFTNRDSVIFDDSATEKTVRLNGSLLVSEIVFDGSSDYRLEGFGSIISGRITIAGTGTVELANPGNTYNGPTQINSGATLILSGDTAAMRSEITVASGGTLIMDSAPAGANHSSFLIEAGGILQIGRATSSTDVFPNHPVSVVNHGTIRILDFESVGNISGSGELVAVQELALLEGNSYSGQTRILSGAIIQPIDNAAFGTTAGNTIVEKGGLIRLLNDEIGPPALTFGEDFVFSGVGNGDGALQVTDTVVEFLGSWRIEQEGAQVSTNSQISMSGSLDAIGELVLEVLPTSSILFSGPAHFESGGLFKLGGGHAEFSGNTEFAGPINVFEGTLSVTGNAQVNSSVQIYADGLLELPQEITWHTDSSITGSGLIDGDLVMPGTILPGESSVDALMIDGNLTLTDSSELVIEIGGIVPGEFDRIDVSGLTTLDGTLTFDLVDLGDGIYEPHEGDSFNFLFHLEGVLGSFDQLNLPPLPTGLDWLISFGTITTSLEVVSAITADANLDGMIDGFDFLALQRDHPQLIPIWQTRYGLVSPLGGFSVPEPATWLMLLAAAGTCALCRRQ